MDEFKIALSVAESLLNDIKLLGYSEIVEDIKKDLYPNVLVSNMDSFDLTVLDFQFFVFVFFNVAKILSCKDRDLIPLAKAHLRYLAIIWNLRGKPLSDDDWEIVNKLLES